MRWRRGRSEGCVVRKERGIRQILIRLLLGNQLKVEVSKVMHLSTRAACIIAEVEYRASAYQMCLIRLRRHHKGIKAIKIGHSCPNLLHQLRTLFLF